MRRPCEAADGNVGWSCAIAVERTAPRVIGDAPGVLARFGALARIGEIRVDVALEGNVARPNGASQSLEALFRTRPLELRVWIEHERRPPEPPGETRALRVKPDHEERGAREAEREMRVL